MITNRNITYFIIIYHFTTCIQIKPRNYWSKVMDSVPCTSAECLESFLAYLCGHFYSFFHTATHIGKKPRYWRKMEIAKMRERGWGRGVKKKRRSNIAGWINKWNMYFDVSSFILTVPTKIVSFVVIII